MSSIHVTPQVCHPCTLHHKCVIHTRYTTSVSSIHVTPQVCHPYTLHHKCVIHARYTTSVSSIHVTPQVCHPFTLRHPCALCHCDSVRDNIWTAASAVFLHRHRHRQTQIDTRTGGKHEHAHCHQTGLAKGGLCRLVTCAHACVGRWENKRAEMRTQEERETGREREREGEKRARTRTYRLINLVLLNGTHAHDTHLLNGTHAHDTHMTRTGGSCAELAIATGSRVLAVPAHAHVFMCTCMCTCACVFIVHIFANIHKLHSTEDSLRVHHVMFLYSHIYACTYISIYVCMQIYANIYVYICICYVCAHTNTRERLIAPCSPFAPFVTEAHVRPHRHACTHAHTRHLARCSTFPSSMPAHTFLVSPRKRKQQAAGRVHAGPPSVCNCAHVCMYVCIMYV